MGRGRMIDDKRDKIVDSILEYYWTIGIPARRDAIERVIETDRSRELRKAIKRINEELNKEMYPSYYEVRGCSKCGTITYAEHYCIQEKYIYNEDLIERECPKCGYSWRVCTKDQSTPPYKPTLWEKIKNWL